MDENMKDKTIKQYLSDKGIPTSSAGYKALYCAILVASENPSYSCNEIFTQVGKILYKDSSVTWRKAYKNAHYAIRGTGYAHGPFTFVKDCSVGLE